MKQPELPDFMSKHEIEFRHFRDTDLKKDFWNESEIYEVYVRSRRRTLALKTMIEINEVLFTFIVAETFGSETAGFT